MIWIFIVAVLFFILGSATAIRPKKSEQRRANLRQQALSQGVIVKLATSLRLPKGVTKGDGVYYCLPIEQRSRSNEFLHIRKVSETGVEIKQLSFSINSEKIKHYLGSRPDYIEALYMGDGLCGICWDERDGVEVSKLIVQLNDLKSIIFEL